jgi:hypothetical protein
MPSHIVTASHRAVTRKIQLYRNEFNLVGEAALSGGVPDRSARGFTL